MKTSLTHSWGVGGGKAEMPNAAWLNRTMYLLSNVFIWRKELSGSVCQCGLFNMLADLSLVCIYLPFSVLLQIAFDSAKLQQFKYHLSCRHRKFPTTALQKNPPDSYCNILKSKEHVYLQGFLYFFYPFSGGKVIHSLFPEIILSVLSNGIF